MSLLGHAEARAAGADWPTLVTDRLLTPLRMTATTFAATEADVPAGAVRGHQENGWPAPYWYGQAYLPPARSTWTTAADMTLFIWAVLTNQAPGMAALEPEAEADNGQIGLAWQITEFQNREITWHNGGTGGMRSMLALDRERQQAWSCWATPAAGSTGLDWAWPPATGHRPPSTARAAGDTQPDRHRGRPGASGQLHLRRPCGARTSSRSPSD